MGGEVAFCYCFGMSRTILREFFNILVKNQKFSKWVVPEVARGSKTNESH